MHHNQDRRPFHIGQVARGARDKGRGERTALFLRLGFGLVSAHPFAFQVGPLGVGREGEGGQER
jgi:hypothetical protein